MRWARFVTIPSPDSAPRPHPAQSSRHGPRTLVLLLATIAAPLLHAAPVQFTKGPVVSRQRDGAVVSFTVSRETDVAVTVEDRKGTVLRHLVAGRLGANPPSPLKSNSLSQSLAWDGRDDDGTPVSVPVVMRVAAGLSVRYAGMAFSDRVGPNHVTTVEGMAIAPDGRLYVMGNRSGWLYWPARAIHVFTRGGKYEKTIKPFPADTPLEKLKPTLAFRNKRGYLNPIVHRTQGMTFYPYEDCPAPQMAVANGKIFLPVVPCHRANDYKSRGFMAHMAAVDRDGGVPHARYAGPALGPFTHGSPHMVATSDGKAILMTGFGRAAVWNKQADVHPAVYRVPLPDMGPATACFGDPKTPGSDNAHLNNPRGLCLDGKGHVLVSDFGNNRIVVLKESDMSFLSFLPVPEPTWVAANPATGAIYVSSGNRLLKLKSRKHPEPIAALELISPRRKDSRFTWHFALDSRAQPPIVWAGRNWNGPPAVGPALHFCRDHGNAFSPLTPAGCFSSPLHWRPASGPLHHRVACFISQGRDSVLHVLDERTGETKQYPHLRRYGMSFRLGPDGSIYTQDHNRAIMRFDSEGRHVPFESTRDHADKNARGRLPDLAGTTGTTAWERDFYVDRKNDIYVKMRGRMYHGRMHVDVYGQNGRRKRTVLWGTTDGSYGPRVDAAGNLFMMECVKPVGRPFPAEFESRLTQKHLVHWYHWIYGSIVKFGPEGGNFHLKPHPRNKEDRPTAQPLKLPATAKRLKVNATFRGDDNEIEGLHWLVPGVAHCGDMGILGGGNHCHCTGCDFDVDNFSRVFAPDNGRQRVTVLDANGNVVLHFGAYGNQDHCGLDSYVPDPHTGQLRPRRPEDPTDLKSPFAEPEIAFNWIIGLAATDRHVYVADCANRRVLRCRLRYEAEALVPIDTVP